MGDLNSVDVAQTVHECVLRKYGCLDPKSHSKYGCPVPKCKTLEGVYVDDRLVVGIVPSAQINQHVGPDADILAASRAGYK